MTTLTIRHLTLGTGMPVVCVPITGADRETVLTQAAQARRRGADLAEWRVDQMPVSWLQEITAGAAGCADTVASADTAADDVRTVPAGLCGMLTALRSALGELPLLFTYRSAVEGGAEPGSMAELSDTAYLQLNRLAIASGLIDLIDVELSRGEAVVQTLIREAHAAGSPVAVICSSHDFHRTPSEAEMTERLLQMALLGADLPKLAVMPHSERDVLALLSVTQTVSEQLQKPVITMSMGALGAVSRVAGGAFGSALTFASTGVASAPGQMQLEDLKVSLKMLYNHENDVTVS